MGAVAVNSDYPGWVKTDMSGTDVFERFPKEPPVSSGSHLTPRRI